MKKKSKLALGVISLPFVGIGAFVAIFHVGARIAAEPMEEIRASLDVGMSQAEVQALMRKYDGVSDQDFSSDVIQISQVSRNVTSPLLGSWFCALHVQMGADGVEAIDDVFCVD